MFVLCTFVAASRFTGSVKLKGVVLIGGEDDYHPRELRLFKNRPALGFDDIQGEPDQCIQLSRDTTGTVEYPVKWVKDDRMYMCVHPVFLSCSCSSSISNCYPRPCGFDPMQYIPSLLQNGYFQLSSTHNFSLDDPILMILCFSESLK